MTQTDLFSALGAPLANARWSWGSVRASDGVVFLRVWQDLVRKHDGRYFVEVTHRWKFEDYSNDPANQERLKHVELIRNGAICYLIMCQVVDPDAPTRRIKSFDSEELRIGGELIELDGDWWIELGERVPVRKIIGDSSGR